ncbi:hypothetical protein HDE_12998 [Halotydeus destructor]|nr:hypothetical protein HDE_12998 [Halotydeus destructor]
MKWDRNLAKLAFLTMFILQVLGVAYYAWDTPITTPGVRLRLIVPAALALLSIIGLLGVTIGNLPAILVYCFLMTVTLLVCLFELRKSLYSNTHIAIWEGHALMVMVAMYVAVRKAKSSTYDDE